MHLNPGLGGMGRYQLLELLQSTGEHRLELLEDRWTGQVVVRKSAELSSSIREAKALLALPDGIAPKLVELQWTKPNLTLVLEHLEGRPLQEVGSSLPLSEIPKLVLAICSKLAHVHRAGWIHADLKPEHILIARQNGTFDVRLLDFGFALDLFGDVSEQTVGGTPRYLAPELRKGWLFDGRADNGFQSFVQRIRNLPLRGVIPIQVADFHQVGAV